VRLWLTTLLRLIAGTYFVVTSLYCLLAYLPYTFCAFIRTPPYAWMPWLAQHQAVLYWLAIAAGLAANWPWQRRVVSKLSLAGIALLVAGGVYLSFRPFLPGLQDNRAAYGWSLVALLPVLGFALWQLWGGAAAQHQSDEEFKGIGVSAGLLAALAISAIYFLGALVRLHSAPPAPGFPSPSFHWQDTELAFWSLATHFLIAITVLTTVNLILWVAAKSGRPQVVRRLLGVALIVVALSVALARFLNNAMSFDGWFAYFYATALACTLTLWGFALVEPFLGVGAGALPQRREKLSSGQAFAAWVMIGGVVLLALGSRWLIGGEDWNGVVESTSALVCWIALSLCVYRLRPVRASYSAAMIVGTLLASIFVYKGLQLTEIFWAKSLGSTDDEISLKLEDYGAHDASFQLAHHILGNGRNETCGDLCRIMREYTNVRDTHTETEVRLVDSLSATKDVRPNIFLFVIDAMRPDYLGAYNSHVDYTPNLDAFARDSIVMHHAYSQYAGTSLSEPALWAGAMMLHAHYLQPFSRVNGLEKMLRADHYHMVVSMDEVAKEILSPTDDLVKLDTDKELWNQLEIGSTLRQAEGVFDSDGGRHEPIFFYDQPKNVHQFARNDVPSPTSQRWQSPAGMNARISYEVHWVDSRLGEFFSYLKQRGMYDDSIIIVTSDHGDATGEFGRSSHSTSIWPEIMQVPLIIHLPAKMREHLVYDDTRLATLTDIAPTLYYLLGHRPIRENPVYGRPLFAATQEELQSHPNKDLLLASDVRAVYGILTADGRYFYTTYDSPAQSYLFDLAGDPNAERSILTPGLKQRYDEEIIEHLQLIGDFYGYRPGVGSLLAVK
jgi:sulfatase-like protein